MDLTINPKVDPSTTAPLMLGGVEFRVAPLMFRQTSRIEPRVPDVLAILNRRAAALSAAVEHPLEPGASPDAASAFLRSVALSEQEAGLLLDVILIGLSRAHARLTTEDLVDLPIRGADLFRAATAILSASSLAEKAPVAVGEA